MLPECYIYVYDTVMDENRWVNKAYVERYPKLYFPAIYKGQMIKSEIWPH